MTITRRADRIGGGGCRQKGPWAGIATDWSGRPLWGSKADLRRSQREWLRRAQPCHCRTLWRRSLHNPICRPSLSCVADRLFVEFTTYARTSRLRASWMEARVTKVTRISARFSRSLARLGFRPNQEKVRSTRSGKPDGEEMPPGQATPFSSTRALLAFPSRHKRGLCSPQPAREFLQDRAVRGGAGSGDGTCPAYSLSSSSSSKSSFLCWRRRRVAAI